MVIYKISFQNFALTAAFTLLIQAAFPITIFAAEPVLEDSAPQTVNSEESAAETELSDAQLIEILSPEEQQRIEQAMLDRDLYIQKIDSLELESADAYSAGLTQAYLDLGFTLQTLNQHEDAVAAFDNALQSTRISNGLNSLSQIPILQGLLDSNLYNSDWDGVDADTHLIYYLARKNFPAGNENRLNALRQLSDWKIKAANEELVSGYSSYASEAADLYQYELKQLEKLPIEENYLSLAALHLGEAEMKLSLAKEIFNRPLNDFQPTGRQSETTTRCFFVRLSNGSVGQMCETIEVPILEYYTEPNERKIRAISSNLDDIRNALLKAQSFLQTETGQLERRDELVVEMQQITESYNVFVIENKL